MELIGGTEKWESTQGMAGENSHGRKNRAQLVLLSDLKYAVVS